MNIELNPIEAVDLMDVRDDNTVLVRYTDIVPMGAVLSRDEVLIRLGGANNIEINTNGCFNDHIQIDIDDDAYDYMYIPTKYSSHELEKKIKEMRNIIKDPQKETSTITLKEAINNYNKTYCEYSGKYKQWVTDKENLKATITDLLGLSMETNMKIGTTSEAIQIPFAWRISPKIFSILEKEGLNYAVHLCKSTLYLQIYLNKEDE